MPLGRSSLTRSIFTGVDVFIAAVLIFQFRKFAKTVADFSQRFARSLVTTLFHTPTDPLLYSNLKTALRRLIRNSIETGTVTSVVALGVLYVNFSSSSLARLSFRFAILTPPSFPPSHSIAYQINQENYISTAICFTLGRLYTLSVLVTLNRVKSLSNGGTGKSGAGSEQRKGWKNQPSLIVGVNGVEVGKQGSGGERVELETLGVGRVSFGRVLNEVVR